MRRKILVSLGLSLLLMLSVIGNAVAETENYHMQITSKSDCKFTLGIFYETEIYRGEETEYIVIFSVDSISESVDFINIVRLEVQLEVIGKYYEWQNNHSVVLMEGDYIESQFVVTIPSKATLMSAWLSIQTLWEEVVIKGTHNFTVERYHSNSVGRQAIKSRNPQDKMWQLIQIIVGTIVVLSIAVVYAKKVLKW